VLRNRQSVFTVSARSKPKREVSRLVVHETTKGGNLDASLIERAKAIVQRYDCTMIKGVAPNVVPLKRI